MLFEHETPLLHSCQQSLFERTNVDKKPCVYHFSSLKRNVKSIVIFDDTPFVKVFDYKGNLILSLFQEVNVSIT